MNRIILYLVILVAISSCMEKNTNNPERAYRYWLGEAPPKEVKVLKAKYWERAHWSKEYEVFIELKASAEWRAAVINQNNFRQDSVYDVPGGAPSWFVPNPHDRIGSCQALVIHSISKILSQADYLFMKFSCKG